MKIEGKKVTFSTGKTLTAENGVIGLSPDLVVYTRSSPYGYDGFFDDFTLNHEESVELADYMICKWQGFKARHI